MALVKSRGNNYPWVTDSWNPMGGRCTHGCSYCYVLHSDQFGHLPKYQGEYRLIEKELKVPFGSGKNIFVCNMTDVFAKDVPSEIVETVLKKCKENPDNEYTFQTKNPAMMMDYVFDLPEKCYLGTTIETDAYPDVLISKAPSLLERETAFMELQDMFSAKPNGWPKFFVTVEPVIKFDVQNLGAMLYTINPDFVNIGADSKRTNLPEPTAFDLGLLIGRLRKWNIEVRLKPNLNRIIGEA